MEICPPGYMFLGKLTQNIDATNLPQLQLSHVSSHLEKFLKAPIGF